MASRPTGERATSVAERETSIARRATNAAIVRRATSAALVGRAAFVGGFLLSILVWLQCDPPSPRWAVASLEHVKRPPVIVPMDLYREAPGPGILRRLVDAIVSDTHPSVVTPPSHPDAQPWPRGMVIHPPPFPDRMATDIPGALDKALSALLGPWLATSS